jgi:murein DD-endopeptidase MepM/ murein hydrolase activator NlpD
MHKKCHTFLIFPGAQGKLRKVRLPFYLVHMVLAFSVVGIMTIAALANSYARMLLKVANYNNLRTEREALKSRNRSLENAVTTTNAKLDSLQSLASEVALAYGFGEARRPHFPEAALSLATQTNSTLESSYRASLYAFNLIRNASFVPSRQSPALGLVTNGEFGHETMPSLWPVHGRVSEGFGQRLDPFSGEGVFHSGVDISVPFGTQVEASGDGIVLFAQFNSGYGNEIIVDHGYGITTKYGHLSKIFVVMGEEVKSRQLIGAVGMTGRTTGPHLHYEVLVNDTPVNPMKYLHE